MSAEKGNKGFSSAFELEKATKNTYKFSEKAESSNQRRHKPIILVALSNAHRGPPSFERSGSLWTTQSDIKYLLALSVLRRHGF